MIQNLELQIPFYSAPHLVVLLHYLYGILIPDEKLVSILCCCYIILRINTAIPSHCVGDLGRHELAIFLQTF